MLIFFFALSIDLIMQTQQFAHLETFDKTKNTIIANIKKTLLRARAFLKLH